MARVQRFFRALGHHLALGFAEATAAATVAVGVHRTTAQRWLRGADLDALPLTPALGREGVAFLRTCVQLHRRGRCRIEEVLPDSPAASDDRVKDVLAAVDDVAQLMAKAMFQAAAMRTGEVPSWVDGGLDLLPARHVLSPSRRLRALGLVQDVADRMYVDLPGFWWKRPTADAWRLRWNEPLVREWLIERCGLLPGDGEHLGYPRTPEWLLVWLQGLPAPDPIDDEWLRWWMKRHYFDRDSTVSNLLARAATEPVLPGELRLWLVFQAPHLSAIATRRGKIYGRIEIRTNVVGPSFKLPVELHGFTASWDVPDLVLSNGKVIIASD